jgi:hypothetical protein
LTETRPTPRHQQGLAARWPPHKAAASRYAADVDAFLEALKADERIVLE